MVLNYTNGRFKVELELCIRLCSKTIIAPKHKAILFYFTIPLLKHL